MLPRSRVLEGLCVRLPHGVSREERGSAHDLDSYLATSVGRTWTDGGTDQ